MANAIVFGDWAIRHKEPRKGALQIVNLQKPVDGNRTSHVLDLRRFGEENLEHDRVPLALVQIDGSDVQISALLVRQDLHQIHLLRPQSLSRCKLSDLAETLSALFDHDHLRLNNFECCAFPLPEADRRALTLYLDAADITRITHAIVAQLDDGAWPGFNLKPGKPIQFVSGEVSVLQSISDKQLYILRRGTLKKKKDPLQHGWQIEIFDDDGGRGWRRHTVKEIPAVDLAPFDQRPETVAGLHAGGPLARLGSLQEVMNRIQIECGDSGIVVELELAFRQIASGKDWLAAHRVRLAQRCMVLRPSFSRLDERPQGIDRDLLRLSDNIGSLSGVGLVDRNASDAPAGLVRQLQETGR